MGNFLFGYSANKDNKFLDYTPAMTNPDSNYPVANLKLYNYLKRPCRSTATTETSITLDFGSAKTVYGVFLNDVNFTSAYIEGSADGSSWPFTESITIVKDGEVQRYKGYFALTGFSYRYLRTRIPSQTPTDGLAGFRISSIVAIDTKLELQESHSYDYEAWAKEAEPQINEFKSGGIEVVSMGDDLIWRGGFGFKNLLDAFEPDIHLLSSIPRDQLIVFHENRGDSSKAYLCRRMEPIKKREIDYGIHSVDALSLLEVV